MAIAPRNFMLTSVIGGVKIQGKNKKGFGGRGVFLDGIDYEPELKFLKSFIGNGSVIIDVGANTGIYSMIAAKIIGENGTVVSIEPFPEMSDRLVKNAALNKYTNIRVRTFGVSDKTKNKTLWLNDNMPNSFSFSVKKDNAKGISFLTVCLDDLFEWEGLSRIDYIKIDAEGEEDNVLAGAKKIIQKFQPVIQAEKIISAPLSLLPGYKVFHIPTSGNLMFIPSNSEKISIAKDMRWEVVN